MKLLWILRKTRQEQRAIRRMMSDYRTGTAKAVLTLLAAAVVLCVLAITLATYGWI